MIEAKETLVEKAIRLLDGMPKNYQYMFLSVFWEVYIDDQEMTQDEVYEGWNEPHPEHSDVTLYEFFRDNWAENGQDEINNISSDDESMFEGDYIRIQLDRLVE